MEASTTGGLAHEEDIELGDWDAEDFDPDMYVEPPADLEEEEPPDDVGATS